MKVILDTNVWRRINSDYRSLGQKLETNNITIFLSETVFTLEGVQKLSRNGNVGRLEFFQNLKENDFCLNPHLGKALDITNHLKIKVLKTPRIMMPINIDLPKEIYFKDTDCHERMNKMGEITRAFPNAGHEHFKSYIRGLNLTEPWPKNLNSIPDSERDNFAKAIAEWADGDTVGACYGYNIDYLCTADNAIRMGSNSIFSSTNKALLAEKYKLQIISPSELEAIL